MEILVALAALIVLDVAIWFWGVDSRDLGLHPRRYDIKRRWL